jgi:signal transduction histidine kinase/ligand-binding sensor domain-containing protein
MALALQVCALPPAALANDDADLSGFEHTYWMAREGVPGQVSDLAQTTDGYLWLATGQSLFRFDGAALERFRTAEGNPVPRVSALAAHPDGSLWVGLHGGGLVRISNGQTSFFGVAQGVPSGVPHDLAVDRNGIVVAAIADQLATGGKGGWHVHALAGAGDNPRVRSVLVDRDGGVWAGGAQLWYRAPGHRDFVPSGVATGGVTALAQAPDGRVWAADSASASIFPVTSSGGSAASDRRYSHRASAMIFDLDGGLWIATTGDGIRYVPFPNSDTELSSAGFGGPQGLSGEVVGNALRDREGNLRFGTNAGLDRFRQPDLVKAGFPSAAYNFALAIDSDGAVWAGSMNRPAVRLVDKHLTTSRVPFPVTVAHRNPEGHVWLAGPSGFWRSRGAAIEHFMDLPEGIDSSAVVRAIVEDGKGRLWASINEYGLYLWHAGAWSPETVQDTLPSQRMPVRAVLDREGWPWFGYRDNLLVSLQNGQVLRWGPKDGLSVGHVTALLVTESRFWVGGSHGLSLFDGKSFVPMRFADGFRISGLHGLVETVTDELWLHGYDGLVRIEADQIARFLEDPSYPVKSRPLGPLELADDAWQVRPLPTVVSGEDGNIWIATSVGVRRVHPHRVAAAAAPPPAPVVSLRADDGPIQTESGAVLPVLPRRIVIAYTATGLKSPETLRFRYRLRGYDEAWHQAGSAREATYIGLPPGRYDFVLSAAYGDGPWSDPRSMQFAIPPALHQTTQFIALCAAFVALLLWVAHRLRIRHLANGLRTRLEVQHQERDRIARELHDTLLQSVQGLMLRFQVASNKLAANEPARKAIELALDHADQVMIEGRDRVVDLRIPERRAGGILDALAALGGELSAVHGVPFQTIVQGKLPPLPATVEDELLRIAQEALINAFRHANASEIELEMLSDHKGVRLRIRDDGVGMPAGVLERKGRAGHWGVVGMRERAEKIGARFEVWSREGSGTEADICLPWASLPGHVQSDRSWFRWFKRPR